MIPPTKGAYEVGSIWISRRREPSRASSAAASATTAPLAAPSRLYALLQIFIALLPLLAFVAAAWLGWQIAAKPVGGSDKAGAAVEMTSGGLAEPGGEATTRRRGGLAEPPGSAGLAEPPGSRGGLAEPPGSGGLAEPGGSRSGGLAEPPGSGGLAEPPGSRSGSLAEPPGSAGLAEPPGSRGGLAEPPARGGLAEPGSGQPAAAAAEVERVAPTGYWIGVIVGFIALVAFYRMFSFARFELFKMLLASFFPLVFLIRTTKRAGTAGDDHEAVLD